MHHKINGGAIYLQRYEIDCAKKLCEAAIESSRSEEFTRWMPWCHENYALSESETFVKHSLEAWEGAAEYNYAIFEAASGEFVGGVGLNQFRSQKSFANLGYWVRVSKQNRGLASAAARLLAEASFQDLPINRIEILAAVENEASQKVAEKSGATREGVLRKRLLIGDRIHDGVMFSFVREDFQKK